MIKNPKIAIISSGPDYVYDEIIGYQLVEFVLPSEEIYVFGKCTTEMIDWPFAYGWQLEQG